MILVIFAWAEDRVHITNMGFGIGDKLADAMHVLLVCSGQMHPLSIFMNNNCSSKVPFLENIIVH